jgi:hypothetical protein
MQLSSDFAAWNSSGVAPTIKDSSPDLAFMMPPDTGASWIQSETEQFKTMTLFPDHYGLKLGFFWET